MSRYFTSYVPFYIYLYFVISVIEANFARFNLHNTIHCHSWLDANEVEFVKNLIVTVPPCLTFLSRY